LALAGALAFALAAPAFLLCALLRAVAFMRDRLLSSRRGPGDRGRGKHGPAPEHGVGKEGLEAGKEFRVPYY
jgi:hypothetical protein